MKKLLKICFLAVMGLISLNSCKNELPYPSQSPAKIALVHTPNVVAWSGEEVLGSTFGVNSISYSTRSSVATGTGTYTKWQSDRGWENIPDEITEDEVTYVLNYIKKHPDEGYNECNLVNYYIQNVGGSYDEYELYFNENNIQKCKGSEKMNWLNINGIHVNDFNAATGGGNWGLCENMPLNDPYYQESYANTYQHDAYKFYYITYNGKTNVYLCFDYRTEKDDNGHMNFKGDGVYNDWVIKLSPADGSEVEKPSTDTPPVVEPEEPVVPTPDVVAQHNNEVEVNFEIVDSHDYPSGIADLVTKLSIHVRHATDVTIRIPVPTEYIIESDDLYIFNEHYVTGVYGGTLEDLLEANAEQSVTYNIGGNTVTLTVSFDDEGILVKTSGITQEVIDYCFDNYGDGINFEVWNYYQTEKVLEDGKVVAANDLTRNKLKGFLDQSTITFTDDPDYYINAYGWDWKGEEHLDVINPDDCKVAPKSGYKEPYRSEHLNGTPYNYIYVKNGVDTLHSLE